MRKSTRRRQLEESQRGLAALPHGPFGRVKVDAPTAEQLAHGAERGHSGRTAVGSMSMTEFFEYLHDHEATTELAQALADVAMRGTCSSRPVPGRSKHARIAS
jgi:hypothetical protein